MLWLSTVDQLRLIPSRFRWWHVEPLLNQAADLLDRCLRDRAEYDGLASSSALLDVQRLEDKLRRELVKERIEGLLHLEKEILEKSMEREYGSETNKDFNQVQSYLMQSSGP